LPPGIAPGQLPSPVTQAAPQFQFEEHWWRNGNHLREQTEIHSSVGRVCSPAEVAAVRIPYLAIAAKINPVLRFRDLPSEPSSFFSKSQSQEQMPSEAPPK